MRSFVEELEQNIQPSVFNSYMLIEDIKDFQDTE